MTLARDYVIAGIALIVISLLLFAVPDRSPDRIRFSSSTVNAAEVAR